MFEDFHWVVTESAPAYCCGPAPGKGGRLAPPMAGKKRVQPVAFKLAPDPDSGRYDGAVYSGLLE